MLLAAKYGVSDSSISRVYKLVTGKTLRPYHTPLSPTDKEAIVATLQSKKATVQELADKYKVGVGTIRRIFVQMTGKILTLHRPNTKIKLTRALNQRKYRAWHKQERKLYEVLGIDWFYQKLKILDSGLLLENGKNKWHDMHAFILMEYSGLRDRKQTPEYPKGQEICEGDIVRFPILLMGNDGVSKETIVTDVVTLEHETGWFVLPQVDADPLVLHNDECEVIGTVYENPELISKVA